MAKDLLWYIAIKDNTEVDGPYAHEEIESFYRSGKLNADAFLYSNNFLEKKWYRLVEIKDFCHLFSGYPALDIPEIKSTGIDSQLKRIKVSTTGEGEYGIENEYRRFPRAPFEGEVFIHNQQIFSKATSVDISEKGISVSMDDSDIFQVGEDVSVTVYGSCIDELFSVRATVMRTLNHDFSGLGLYFIMITPVIRKKIANYVVKTLNAKKEINEAS